METDGAEPLIDPLKKIQAPDTALCSGCGRCVAACTQRLFTLEIQGFRKIAVKEHASRCKICGQCVDNCPVNAITL